MNNLLSSWHHTNCTSLFHTNTWVNCKFLERGLGYFWVLFFLWEICLIEFLLLSCYAMTRESMPSKTLRSCTWLHLHQLVVGCWSWVSTLIQYRSSLYLLFEIVGEGGWIYHADLEFTMYTILVQYWLVNNTLQTWYFNDNLGVCRNMQFQSSHA